MDEFVTKYQAAMQEAGVPAKVYRRVDWTLVHPKCIGGFILVGQRIIDAHRRGELTQLYLPFEGYRSPPQQIDLVRRNVSKAMPWQSAHNYGMAVDFVGWNEKDGWNWQPADSRDWQIIGQIATNAGMLRPITWDKPHVEHPLWHSLKRQLV